MDLVRENKYEKLYNIKLSELYTFVTDVMQDFGCSLHRALKDVDAKRRVELWAYHNREEQQAVVWIEVVKPGESIDPFLATDVLRTMNDENVTRLFFFTNGTLSEGEREILEGMNHFIFTTEEIVETLVTIEMKRSIRVVRKRKKVKVPSAIVLIKNFLKANKDNRKSIRLKVSAIPDLADQYFRIVRRIMNEIDKIPDINEIPPETRERLKRIQYDLLPELIKTPSYLFVHQFAYLRSTLFTLVEYTIVYIGNVIEYEAEDDLKKNRDVIEEMLTTIADVEEQVNNYKNGLMFSSEKISVKIIMYSAIFAFISLMIMIVLRLT